MMTVNQLLEKLQQLKTDGYGDYDIMFDEVFDLSDIRAPEENDEFNDCVQLW